MTKKQFLPLGTIVSLKDSDKKLLIIGVHQKSVSNNSDILYDYCACLHPYGYVNSEDIFLFNNEKIDKIYFQGYYDNETEDYYEDIIWSLSRGEKNE